MKLSETRVRGRSQRGRERDSDCFGQQWVLSGWAPADSPLPDPLLVARYKAGDPIILRFSYSGEHPDWDAMLYFDEESAPPIVRLGASAVFVVSKGIGPFESRVTRDRKTYAVWELLEAPRGQVVVPKNRGFGSSSAYMVVVNEPFDFVVDLTRYFELEEPGVYTLLWGCKPKYLTELVIEVVP